jgi:hypothetical protein
MHSLALGAVSLIAALSAASAHADGPRAELSAMGGLGLGSTSSPVFYDPGPNDRIAGDAGPIYARRSAPYRVSAASEFTLGIAFGEWFTAGVFGTYRPSGTSAPEGVRDLTRTTWSAGPYVRVNIPVGPPNHRSPIAPWSSIGVGYAHDDQSWSTVSTIPGVSEQWKLEDRGVALRLAVGIEYHVTDFLGFGPQFALVHVEPTTGCARIMSSTPGVIGNDLCTGDAGHGRVTGMGAYSMWSVGVAARIVIPGR